MQMTAYFDAMPAMRTRLPTPEPIGYQDWHHSKFHIPNLDVIVILLCRYHYLMYANQMLRCDEYTTTTDGVEAKQLYFFVYLLGLLVPSSLLERQSIEGQRLVSAYATRGFSLLDD